MKAKLFVRKAHRYLGIFIAIQLLFWTASGAFFAFIPIQQIRGEHLLKPAAKIPLDQSPLVSPSALLQTATLPADVTLGQLRLGARLSKPAYLLTHEGKVLAFDARTGKPLGALTEGQARQVAFERTGLPAASAELVTQVSAGDEYRGGELPAWRITTKDNTHLYVGANSGALRAVRTPNWRIYDFLWGLHIMDWQERENFNHWLLKAAAGIALFSVIAGIVVFVQSSRTRRRLRNMVTSAR